MKKYKITVQETVRFNHEWTIEIPDDADIDKILDTAEKRFACLDDVEITDCDEIAS